ncbi:MAG: tetratricopeptide repeat protein [Bacteroidetes bacterium]|nr:tetratricopeptide repeat protein [Bacteroidota bacterium]
MFRKIISFALLFIAVFSLAGQEKKANPIPDIRQGNKLFNGQKYEEAEIWYRKAIEKDPKNKEAVYNLGTAQYQQKKFDDAIESFKKSVENYSTKSEGIDAKQMRAGSYHNLGNAHLMKKDAEKAIEAYKSALKLNPTDMDTKYNLVLAMQEQKNQQQNKDGKGDKNKDQKDKKDGKGDQDQNKDGDKKDGQGDKGDEKKDGEGKDGKGDEKGEKKGTGKEQLDALQNQEKKTQEKMQRIKGKPVPVKVEKDW